MAITTKERNIFDSLQSDELILVSNYASSLIRNRRPHTEAHEKFIQFRERMLKKNPMSSEEIDKIIHEEV